MPIPTYDKCMLPLLQFAGDGQPHHIREAVDALAWEFQITEEELNERLPSGKKSTFNDRVQWANTYLKKAGLLHSVRRGIFEITPLGREVLAENLEYIDRNYLMRFPGFVEFQTVLNVNHSTSPSRSEVSKAEQTPQEILQQSYQDLREQLAHELLDQIMESPPSFFEKLVVDLLVAMGYGGSLENAGRAVGKTGDGGIDGIINEDKLGFDVIYIQAKRWDFDNVVSRPTVQAFAGTLMGQGVTKGVLITTSRFSREAIEYAHAIKQLKIILLDGQQLAELMIDHNIGVNPVETYVIKRLDSDYFELD